MRGWPRPANPPRRMRCAPRSRWRNISNSITSTTAALIVEPLVQGAAGMAMYHPAYLAEARRLCDRYHVHLIADEIMTGFGRTGTFFAHEQAHIVPDFLCLSKGITGGYLPLSVVMTRDAIYQAFYDDSVTRGFLHSHSYTGNALACRAALATLKIFETKTNTYVESRSQRSAYRGSTAHRPPSARQTFSQCRHDLGV